MLPIISASPNPIRPNLCVNCRYFTNTFFTPSSFGKCILFSREDDNTHEFLVNGRKQNTKISYSYCSTARKWGDMCGKEGKLYEKK